MGESLTVATVDSLRRLRNERANHYINAVYGCTSTILWYHVFVQYLVRITRRRMMTRPELNLAIATLVYPVEEGYHHWVDEDGYAIAESETAYEWFALALWETLMTHVIENRVSLCDIGNGKSWDAFAIAKCLLAVLKEKNKC